MTDVAVTQEDRDAAADAVKAYRDQRNGNWQQRIRDGKCDDGEMVQAFARHRQSSTEDVERLREALTEVHDAIAEYYRYFTGGETRGSYDGKPERARLWKAQHKARTALTGVNRHDD